MTYSSNHNNFSLLIIWSAILWIYSFSLCMQWSLKYHDMRQSFINHFALICMIHIIPIVSPIIWITLWSPLLGKNSTSVLCRGHMFDLDLFKGTYPHIIQWDLISYQLYYCCLFARLKAGFIMKDVEASERISEQHRQKREELRLFLINILASEIYFIWKKSLLTLF